MRYFKPIVSLLLATGFAMGCGAGGSGGSPGTLTLDSSRFPELAEMVGQVDVDLDIGAITCPLTVDADTTLSGRCAGIAVGSHRYTLRYTHRTTGVILAVVEGTVTLEQGKNVEIPLSPRNTAYDNDGDRYSNLGELVFGTDPKDRFAYPFKAAVSYPVGDGPSSVALGDLDRDGVLDVVTANWGSDSLSVLLGASNAALNTPVSVTYVMGSVNPGRRHPDGVAFGDLNNDGAPDVVVINSGANSGFRGDVAVFLGHGDGTLEYPAYFNSGAQPTSLAVGDVNGDGLDDVVTGNSGSKDVTVLVSRADTLSQYSLQPAVPPIETGLVSTVSLRDLNGDGRLDLITSLVVSQSVAVFLGNGDGTFQSDRSFVTGIVDAVVFGDVNGDTRLDLIGGIFDSSMLAVLMGKGDGTFQTTRLFETTTSMGSLVLGDVDSDGHFDLVTENAADGVVAVLLGNGDGTFRAATFHDVGPNPSSVALGDLNGDWELDIVATNRDGDTIAVLLREVQK